MRILITGGAGFVGSALSRLYREKYPKASITAFDNLRRRGSEINLPLFKKLDVDFHHGDIRNPGDFAALGSGHFDLFVEASAEPSVLAGMRDDSPLYAIETNLLGTVNALEFARWNCGVFAFLSTSRVYSIPALLKIALKSGSTRFELDEMNDVAGLFSGAAGRAAPVVGAAGHAALTREGITEKFPTDGYRSIYGSTKLASELLVQEYAQAYGLNAVIDRCGVIAGPGQFGRVDQGVFTLWVARHFFGQPLKYTGFGGKGLQVRDLLHPADLFELLEKQIGAPEKSRGEVFNVGGGMAVSTSLAELTALCREVVGREVAVASEESTSSVDIPYYVSDCAKAERAFSWKPARSVRDIVTNIRAWLAENETALKPLFE